MTTIYQIIVPHIVNRKIGEVILAIGMFFFLFIFITGLTWI
jgi:hypothetical protein